MILDNEEQRLLILKFIEVVPIQGNYNQLKPLVEQIDNLKIAVQAAQIGMKDE